jgi:hypothetical protein
MLFSGMMAVGCEKQTSYLLFLNEAQKLECTAWKNAKIPAAVQMVHCSNHHF